MIGRRVIGKDEGFFGSRGRNCRLMRKVGVRRRNLFLGPRTRNGIFIATGGRTVGWAGSLFALWLARFCSFAGCARLCR
jgi:hypothetical protein